jgi:hypothetical protein
MAFSTRDLMVPVARPGGIPFNECTLFGTCLHYTPEPPVCPAASPYCVATPDPAGLLARGDATSPAAGAIHPADLAGVQAQLSQALNARRTAVPAGSGLAFTTRDLMTSVLPRLNDDNDCKIHNSECNEASCSASPGPCEGTPDTTDYGDLRYKVINPPELSEIQAVLQQAVLKSRAQSGAYR